MLVSCVIEQPNSQNKTENFGEPVLVESRSFVATRAFLSRLAPFCRDSRPFVATRDLLS